MAITVLLGMLTINLSNPANKSDYFGNQIIGGGAVFHVKIRRVQKPTSFSERYLAEVFTTNEEKTSGKILLNFPLDSLSHFKVDDELLVVGKPEKITPPLNPHQFDYRAYLSRMGIDYQMSLEKNTIIRLGSPSKTIAGLAINFRETLIGHLKSYPFGHDELGVVQALLLGKRDDISEQTYTDYKNAGALHILAVSGLHVGIIMLLLQFLLYPLERLPKGKTIKIILVIALLWCFALVAGLSPSVVRAVTMFSFFAYSWNVRKPTNSFNIIALSMLAILLIWPNFLFGVGFQMSYAAVIGIVWIYPKLQWFWRPANLVLRKLWDLVSVSVAAQLGVLPISLFYFHQFPSLFFVSNLVVIPFLGLVLGLGFLVLTLAYFSLLPAFLVTFYDGILKIMNEIISWVAHQEDFVLKDISFDAVQMIMTYVLIIGLVITFTKLKFKNLAWVLCAILGLSIWTLHQKMELQKKETLLLAHQTKNSVLFHQMQNRLLVLSHDQERAVQMVKNYKIGERIGEIKKRLLQNSYEFLGKSIFIMDSSGVYPQENFLDFLVLTQSPKINLDRLLDSISPKIVIADGSNYHSYVKRWQQSCLQEGIPFHYTGGEGAFHFGDISN